MASRPHVPVPTMVHPVASHPSFTPLAQPVPLHPRVESPWLMKLLQSTTSGKSYQWSEQQRLASEPQPGDDDEVDVLRKLGDMAVQQAVAFPPKLEECDSQAEVFYVDGTRNALSQAVLSCLQVRPNTVVLHVYDLNEGLVQANAVGVFQVGMGGAFHIGTEVYGGEWSYGVLGVTVDTPRLTTAHAYKCSVIAGCTDLDQVAVAELLKDLVKTWRSQDYDVIGHNCCGFASEFCNRLAVGPMPPWIDRLSRLLHGGRSAGEDVSKKAAAFTAEASRFALALPGKVQPHVERAAMLGMEMFDASRGVWEQADQQAQSILANLWAGTGCTDRKRSRGREDSSVDCDTVSSLPVFSEQSMHSTEHDTGSTITWYPQQPPHIMNPSRTFAPAHAELSPNAVQNFALSGTFGEHTASMDSQSTLPAYSSFEYAAVSRDSNLAVASSIDGGNTPTVSLSQPLPPVSTLPAFTNIVRTSSIVGTSGSDADTRMTTVLPAPSPPSFNHGGANLSHTVRMASREAPSLSGPLPARSGSLQPHSASYQPPRRAYEPPAQIPTQAANGIAVVPSTQLQRFSSTVSQG